MSRAPLLFMGSPEVAVIVLRALLEAGYLIPAVITQPDKPAGRGQKLTPPPVKVYAESKGIQVLQPTQLRDPLFLEQLKSYQPQTIVVAAYGRIIPNEILEFPSLGCVNVHFSLLPKYRGASCVVSAILNGDKEIGVTVMKVVQKLDAGPILGQSKIPLLSTETTGEVESKLAHLGGELLIQTLQALEQNSIKAIEQDEALVTYAPLLKKEEAKIDWSLSAEKINRLIHAMNPWPIGYTFVDKKRLKVYDGCEKSDWSDKSDRSDRPGTILQISKEGIEVACGIGTLLLKEVQLEGKKRMQAYELSQGERSLQPGKVLE